MRQLFDLGCAYSGMELSLNKMLGQLQDAGNVTTLANYLNTLGEAGLLCGLQKYAKDWSATANPFFYASMHRHTFWDSISLQVLEICLSLPIRIG